MEAFDGTATGRLLRQLYKQRAPNIIYPKPKPEVKRPVVRPPKPVVRVPRRKVAVEERHPIEDVQRKGKGRKFVPNTYKPSPGRGYGDEEKRRLQDVFQYSGGKGLPEELTQPKGKTPQERREEARVRREWNKRRGEVVEEAAPEDGWSLEREIAERQEYVRQMRALGYKTDRVDREIAIRLNELRS